MTALEWFERARQEGFAIGAFNVDNLEIFKAVCLAGKRKNSPVMLEFSSGETGYFGLENIKDLIENAREEYKIPILLNLDHSKKVEDCIEAIELGIFDDVHFDGSELSFEENAKSTKKVVEAAKSKNKKVLVEAEIDKVLGTSEEHGADLDMEALRKGYTNPELAANFVLQTGADIFAAVFGNVHGTYPIQPDLDFELLAKIAENLRETFISMHGGSGIPAEQVREAIRVGKVVKVNVNTELRKAFHDALVQKVEENPSEMTHYKIADDVIGAVASVVEGKIEVFGSAGKA